ncbi:ABC transporter, ATP-binding protein [Paenibacillus sp. JCM 10914]|nr:ABC transporter, ATP-binding protein [Paenibacillus sp. JCM 10914]
MLHQPKLLILDEPTNGLDPQGIRELRDYLRRLTQEEGTTVFVSSHLLSEMELMCDTVAIIRHGKLIDIRKLRTEEGERMFEETAFIVSDVGVALQSLNAYEVRALGDRIIVRGNPDMIADMNAELVGAGVRVFGIQPVTQSLEDQFLEMTGGVMMLNNFASLIVNENMKIYYRVRTWVMLGILIFFNAAMPAILFFSDASMDPWTVFTWTESFTLYLSAIFTVMIASDIMAGEFTGGTIKLLLIRPWSRGKILMSKLIAFTMFGLLCAIITAAVGIVSSMLFFAGSQVPSELAGQAASHALLLLLTDTIQVLVIALIAFMLSTVFRSGGLSIGLSLLVLFTKDLIGFIFSPERYGWAKYLLFQHTDLSVYIRSSVGPGGVSLGFSVTMLALYSLLFVLISWLAFARGMLQPK